MDGKIGQPCFPDTRLTLLNCNFPIFLYLFSLFSLFVVENVCFVRDELSWTQLIQFLCPAYVDWSGLTFGTVYWAWYEIDVTFRKQCGTACLLGGRFTQKVVTNICICCIILFLMFWRCKLTASLFRVIIFLFRNEYLQGMIKNYISNHIFQWIYKSKNPP